ncbi:hypothetical protein [Leucothrix arctica]|uniref:Uncharacterized protein n=1 Tax=Leucothrix arctica TaxID=1481894 RepID=A0A317C470_9GAMM|nr:hypothetical protein [Leucothrix arctica]PWQ93486.1 hypothetical protein DKT75_17845 [Leucothrix arctica]
MPANFLKLLPRKPILLLALLIALTLTIVAGCISNQKSVKTIEPTPAITVSKPPKAKGIDSIQLQAIGQKIYLNETGGKPENLVYWNPNEAFPSLGIGHFIWFPAGSTIGFTESFPDMIRFLKANGADVPSWLLEQITVGALWRDQADLNKNRSSDKVQELQQFLSDTSGLQALYLFQRLDSALPKIVRGLETDRQKQITERFNTVKSSPGGLYLLVDYVNFKGEGIVTSEQHNNVGWGLRQVLETMEPTQTGNEALKAFATAADIVLTHRVANAPVERNEQRWLPGWRVRLKTYYQQELDV